MGTKNVSLGGYFTCYILFNLSLISCFTDLRRFRTYKGSHVRDLLRAMRNKVIVKACSNALYTHYTHSTLYDRHCIALLGKVFKRTIHGLYNHSTSMTKQGIVG